MRSGGHQRPSILADALEAIFGAIFLDAGFDAASKVINRIYARSIAEIDPASAGKDPKTALQEWLQARRHALPKYEMVIVRGEAHSQEFEVSCLIPALMIETKGRGASRRAAEQQAARDALDRIEKL